LNKEEPLFYDCRASVRVAIGHWGGAIEDYNAAIMRAPVNSELRTKLLKAQIEVVDKMLGFLIPRRTTWSSFRGLFSKNS